MTRRAHDFYGDYNFHIEIDGIHAGAFQKCDGLSFEVDLIEYKDSGDDFPRYRPGIRRVGKIKLTKGYTASSALWDWCQAIMEGKNERHNGVIELLDDDANSPVVRYEFIDAFPIKWNGFRLDGKGTTALVEDIELAVEQIIRKK